jgi:uncharacterized membrane protein
MTENTSLYKTKRWIKVLLVISLALNLMIAGVVLGTVVSSDKRRDGPPDRREANFGPMTRALAPEDRRKLGREIRRATKDLLSTARPDWQNVLTALRSDTFDPEELRRVFASQRDMNAARMSVAQDVLIQHILELSDPDRLEFADRLETALEKPPHRQRN